MGRIGYSISILLQNDSVKSCKRFVRATASSKKKITPIKSHLEILPSFYRLSTF